MSTIHIYSDGAARGNPGPSGIGVVVLDETGRVLGEYSRYLGDGTNNQAEYQGLIAGLLIAQSFDGAAVRVHLDSELVVQQMSGAYRVKSEGLRPLYLRASSLMARLGDVSVDHVSRDKNAIADRLANSAIDRYHQHVAP